MGCFENLAGQRFGRLLVGDLSAPSRTGLTRWRAKCDCGKSIVTNAATLKRGRSLSCGCLRIERAIAALTRHGMTKTPEHKAWRQIKTRCNTLDNPRYSSWGGRGIKMCSEWENNFEAFFAYVGPRPSPGHSIDRIDNDGHYEPGNVRWATRTQQNQNRRLPNRGKKLCINVVC